MRIALIDPSLFTWQYDSALALALAAAGHEVALFGKPTTRDDAGPGHALLHAHFYRELDSDWARRLPKGLFLGVKGVSHIGAMFRLVRALKAWKPDVIHFQWSPLPVVDRWFVPILRKIAPLVMTAHDLVPYNGNPSSQLLRLSSVSILEQFDRLIVHTHDAAGRLRGLGLPETRIRRIPHGPMGIVEALPEAAWPQRDPEAPLHILLFGRIKPYKGADLLVRAAAAMRPELLRLCRIHIIGQPFMDLNPLERMIESAGIGQHVQLEPRFVAEGEVAGLLASADIIALPYREIDASGVLMSVLAAGVPVVATRVGLFGELLEDGKHGRLIPLEDHLALARALEELVGDPELRTRMGAAVRRLRDEIPDWSAIADMTVDLYRELLPPQGGRDGSAARAAESQPSLG